MMYVTYYIIILRHSAGLGPALCVGTPRSSYAENLPCPRRGRRKPFCIN